MTRLHSTDAPPPIYRLKTNPVKAELIQKWQRVLDDHGADHVVTGLKVEADGKISFIFPRGEGGMQKWPWESVEVVEEG